MIWENAEKVRRNIGYHLTRSYIINNNSVTRAYGRVFTIAAEMQKYYKPAYYIYPIVILDSQS